MTPTFSIEAHRAAATSRVRLGAERLRNAEAELVAARRHLNEQVAQAYECGVRPVEIQTAVGWKQRKSVRDAVLAAKAQRDADAEELRREQEEEA